MQYSSIVVGTTTPSRSASACDAATCFLEKSVKDLGHESDKDEALKGVSSYRLILVEPLEGPYLR